MSWYIPITIDVVVEGQLLVLPDQSFRENAHPNMVSNGPLGHITIGIAAVVGESTNPTALRCVDELSPSLSHSGAQRVYITYLIFLEHHKVKVLYPLLRVFSHPLLEASWVDNVTDVLVDECIPTEGLDEALNETNEPHTWVYPPLPATQTPFSPSAQSQCWRIASSETCRAVSNYA